MRNASIRSRAKGVFDQSHRLLAGVAKWRNLCVTAGRNG
jgi:hypothetical protein